MKILLANFSKMIQDSGGLAKVHCNFANAMNRRGHKILMMYMDEREGEFFFPIDAGIETFNIQRLDGKILHYPLSYKMRREVFRVFSKNRARSINDDFIKKFLMSNVKSATEKFKPDVIICFQPTAGKTFLCDIKISTPVIIMSHGDPEDYFQTYPAEEIPALTKCSVCQVLMPSFAENLKRHLPDVNVKVIGNVVPQYEQQADLAAAKDFYKIIFIGRLVRNHKRPHLLIEAFEKISARFPNWTVEIWGAEDKSSYTEKLHNQIEKFQLSDRIFIKGTTKNVAQVLATGDIFVFPSAYEGFGLAAAEAMSMGLPVVAYKNCTAVNELVTDGVNGFLCEDGVESLAEKMSVLMGNQDLRVKFGNSARESVKKYSAEKIWNEWENLIFDLTISKAQP